MNKEAIYHRPNREFCYFIDGRFLVKLRAKRNDIKEAYLYYAEKWLPKEGKLVRVKMELVCSSEMFDYFECLVPPLELGIQYFFELIFCQYSAKMSQKNILIWCFLVRIVCFLK